MLTSSSSDRETFWCNLISRRELSQLTVGEVCAQAGVSQASFFHWQKKLGKAGRQKERSVTRVAPLVPVRLVDDRVAEITLEMPNGFRVRIPQGCDESTLQRVVRVAMSVSRESESC